MVTINFTQFRQKAKDYFDAVEKGETIYIKRHGKVIAQIRPPQTHQPAWKHKALRLKISGESLSKMIIQERQQKA